MGWRIEFLNGDRAMRAFARLQDKLTAGGRRDLFREIGNAIAENVRERIRTGDEGRWKPPSKWVRAKTDHHKALQGAERYVKVKLIGETVQVVGDSPKGWTLTQHHEGFVNHPSDRGDKFDTSGRVILRLQNPAALNRKGRVFMFFPKTSPIVPRRKIWPSQANTKAVAQPIASRWMQRVVNGL